MKKRYEIKWILHALGWVLFFIAPILLSPGPVRPTLTSDIVIAMAVRNATLMALFYFNLLYLTPVMLKKKGVASLLTILLFLIVVVSFFNSSFHQFMLEDPMRGGPPPMPDGPPPFNRDRGMPPFMFAGRSFSSLLTTLIVVVVSSLIVLWEDLTKTQAEKQEQELQKIGAELAALKLQISPHFLFNTLNNIRWLVRSKSDQAEDAVVKLSHLLRYILYQTNVDEVDFENEVEHLRDFVELQKMRLANQDSMTFSVEGDIGGKRIVPLLLLPLVENFFKHGDFTSDRKNKITMEVNEFGLVFRSENQIALSDHNVNSIGLKNVKRRLDLHYPDRHRLSFHTRDGVYFLELELMLT